MKCKKGIVALLAVVFMITLVAPIASTAESAAYNVWIESVPSGDEETLVVPIHTDGQATDGLVTIVYDPSALTVTEAGVVFTSATAMYSANAADSGELKISWIAGDGHQAGILANVTFTVEQKNAPSGLRITGEAHAGETIEADLTVGTVVSNVENFNAEVVPGEGVPGGSINMSEQDIIDGTLTEEEKQQLQDGTDVSIRLKINPVTDLSAEEKAAIEQAASGYTVLEYIYLELEKIIDGVSQNIYETFKPLTIKIDVPEEVRGQNLVFAVIGVIDGKAMVLYDEDTDPDTITFTISQFFTNYAIAYTNFSSTVTPTSPEVPGTTGNSAPTDNSTGTPNTGDETPWMFWTVTAVLSAGGALWCLQRLRRRLRGER